MVVVKMLAGATVIWRYKEPPSLGLGRKTLFLLYCWSVSSLNLCYAGLFRGSLNVFMAWLLLSPEKVMWNREQREATMAYGTSTSKLRTIMSALYHLLEASDHVKSPRRERELGSTCWELKHQSIYRHVKIKSVFFLATDSFFFLLL